MPVQRPHPPVILGGQAKGRSLALAARFATEYNVAFVSAEDVRLIRGRIDKACTEAGRDPADLSVSLMTLVALGVLIIPGVGLVAAGPIVAGFAGAGAGGLLG